jgi:hypothetical protein
MEELGEHQKKVLEKLSNGKILCGVPGSGKSRVALAYYVREEAPRDIVVITTARKRDQLDWVQEAIPFGISRKQEQTLEGTLTVDSWNNIQKYKEVRGVFFIFDEQRVVGSGAWVKSFLKIAQHNRWIMLSATPGDTWLDYIPVFVANGFYKHKTDFTQQHVIWKPFRQYHQVDRYTGIAKLVKLRNSILVDMPYERHTTRHTHILDVEYDKDLFNKVVKERWHVYENRPIRDVAELFSVMRKVVNSDSSRLEKIRELTLTHPRLIVFYNFDYELHLLRMLDQKHSDTFQVAEWNGHNHEPIPTTERWVYLVQYTAGAEAWNCTETDAMCFYSLNYSYKLWFQAFGRIDRMNTPFSDLHYYILKSTSLIDDAIWASLTQKKSFNESAFERELEGQRAVGGAQKAQKSVETVL